MLTLCGHRISHFIISFPTARKGNKDFFNDAFVCFYEDDHEFDSIFGIWFRSKQAYKILSHFAGIITPDFSLYQDFPLPLKLWNTYRMRAFGYWYGTLCGHAVINNARWGTHETYWYCFDGIPENSVVAIGTYGCSQTKDDKYHLKAGLEAMLETLEPVVVLVYGSMNERVFADYRNITKFVHYPDWTTKSHQGGDR